MSFRDVEKAIPEEDENSMPLLPLNNERLRPIRPKKYFNKNNGTPATVHSWKECYIKRTEEPEIGSRCETSSGNHITTIISTVPSYTCSILARKADDMVCANQRLLKAGANANVARRLDYVSACHMAAIVGGDALQILVKYGVEKHRQERLGRTPLHLAAYTGNARQMAILLDFPEDIQKRVDKDDMSSEAEEDVKTISRRTKEMVNVGCDFGEMNLVLPKESRDNIDHNCLSIKRTLPFFQPGWTPLHFAASCARKQCTRLLLAAGANPNICDVTGCTPLDVAGSAYYHDENIDSKNFTDVVKMLLSAGSQFNSMQAGGLNMNTPLHTAVEMGNVDVIKALLHANVSITCLNSAGLTPLHLCVKYKLEQPLQILVNYACKKPDPLTASMDVKDKEGHTVLQAAVEAAWVPGVCIALEAGADVTIKTNDGESPIHSAATLGDLDVLNEILRLAKQRDFIDYKNEKGETPLFKAIIHGHLKCVNALFHKGASIELTMPGGVNVIHAAAEYGHLHILKFLMGYHEDITKDMINALTEPDKKGFGPIHFAVFNNNPDCLKYLISKNADIRLRTTATPYKSSTPLHLAAMQNFEEVGRIILYNDETTIHETNSTGWYPIHTAGYHGSRDLVKLLLREGADLSAYTDCPKKYRLTAFEMIMDNISKPTEFLEEIFDSYITSNSQHFQDVKCEVSIDYRILMPRVREMQQMKVIKALLSAGNRHGQLKLLVHPLVESFLDLKWKALLPFFYVIIAVYALFVTSLTTYVIGIFFYKDTNTSPPPILNPNVWYYIVYCAIFLKVIQELFYMNIKSIKYFIHLETWIKIWSLILAAILPILTTVSSVANTEWPRHIATCAMLLSWIELMFLLSRFPNWGYYVLIFGKVAAKLIKILLIFVVLVIGFSLSFMIQFHSKKPFDGPWAALVKTMVMMTSEFDYVSLFDQEHTRELATSLVIVRIIFVVFLILAAIVLMNLMVGVAVNDINDLKILGYIRRLVKQVEFLENLDNLVYNKFVSKILPSRLSQRIRTKRNVLGVKTFSLGIPKWRLPINLPIRIRDDIIDRADQRKEQQEMEVEMESFRMKIDEMYETITKKKDIKKKENSAVVQKYVWRGMQNLNYNNIMDRLNRLDDGFTKVKSQVTEYIEVTKCPIENLNVKIDQISLEIEEVKEFLKRLESKLGSI